MINIKTIKGASIEIDGQGAAKMTLSFGYRHVLTISPGQSRYSEAIGREQAEVRYDGKRYIYDLGDHVNGGMDMALKAPFKAWVKKTFLKPERKISGTFPAYRID